MANIKGALGLARRAGKVICGFDACERAIRSGKAKIVVVDCELSSNTRKKLDAVCGNVEIKEIAPAGTLGAAIGKSSAMVAVITDAAFAGMINKENI